MNATVSSVPSYLASRLSWAWPTSWVTATQLEAVGSTCTSRTGVASRASSLTRRTASSSASRPTVSRFGYAGGISRSVVRELALDQHGW